MIDHIMLSDYVFDEAEANETSVKDSNYFVNILFKLQADVLQYIISLGESWRADLEISPYFWYVVLLDMNNNAVNEVIKVAKQMVKQPGMSRAMAD